MILFIFIASLKLFAASNFDPIANEIILQTKKEMENRLALNSDPATVNFSVVNGPFMPLNLYLEKKKQLNIESYPPCPMDLIFIKRVLSMYSSEQIKSMASAMEEMIEIADAKKVSTVVEYRENKKPLIIEHTPSDILKLSYRILMQKRLALRMTAPQDFLPIDFVASYYLMGKLSPDLWMGLNMQDWWYKKSPDPLVKIWNYFKNIGLLVLEINPLTGPYTLMGIIIYDSYFDVNFNSEKIDFDQYFFN